MKGVANATPAGGVFVVDVALMIYELMGEEERGDETHTLTATESGYRDVVIN
jgi:hypothetical protein